MIILYILLSVCVALFSVLIYQEQKHTRYIKNFNSLKNLYFAKSLVVGDVLEIKQEDGGKDVRYKMTLKFLGGGKIDGKIEDLNN